MAHTSRPEERTGRRGATPSLDAQETRERILAEAKRLFRLYGYSKTTMADIAGACRMSPANVYRFFASKAAVNDAICARLLASDEEAFRAIARLPLPAADRLRRIVLEMNNRALRAIDENKVNEMFKVAMEERWESVQTHIRRISDLLAGLIEDGIARGEFRPQDAVRAAECLHMAISPLRHPVMIAQYIEDPLRPQPGEMVDFVVAALKG
jgi:AcrR family transcriptional regulator